MPLIFGGIVRAVMWGLSGIGLVTATKAYNGAVDPQSSSDSGPGWTPWLIVLGVLGVVVWLWRRDK